MDLSCLVLLQTDCVEHEQYLDTFLISLETAKQGRLIVHKTNQAP